MRGPVKPQTQEVLRAIIESPKNIVIFALDRDYRYLAFNENHRLTMKAIWGVDIHVGLNMLEEVVGRDDDRVRAKDNFDRALGGESFVLIEEYGDELKQRRIYEDIYSPIYDRAGNVLGLTVYLTDITEQRQSELELERYRAQLEELVADRTRELEAAHAQLLHAQKLESLGVMAGGIAHDFNNILSAILGHTDVALRSQSPEAVSSQLACIRSAVVQARHLTDQLLTSAGKGKFALRAINLSATVNETLALININLPKSVWVACDLGAELPAVEADVSQIRQITMNLVRNSAEAIAGEGEIHVRTYLLEPDAKLPGQTQFGDMRPELRYVCLEVKDTGCGIEADTQRRIFDPFYTSKFAGRGLGLAAVLGVVRNHEGALAVDSQPGVGTTFRVCLPSTERPVDPAGPVQGATRTLQIPNKGSVLLVDDDDRVRSVTADLISLLGLPVVQAASGTEACWRFHQNSEDILLVMLDLTMPGLGGLETLERLRAIRPNVEVILQSGYTADAFGSDLASLQQVQFLHKPFEIDTLIDALAIALEHTQLTQTH